MKVRYHREALADLAEVRAYIARNNAAAAAAVGQRIRAAVAALADFPEQGRPGRIPGARELVIPRLPFIAAYQVTPDHVRVLAILHAARRWPASFEGRQLQDRQ